MHDNKAAKQQWLAYYQHEIDKDKLPVLVATTFSAILLMATSIPLLIVGNELGSKKAAANPRQAAVIAAAILIILAIARAASFFFASTQKQKLATLANQLFQQNVLAHIFRLPANIKQQKTDEEYLAAITTDSAAAAQSLVEAPVRLTSALATLLSGALLLLFIDAKMLIVMAIILPLTYTTLRSIRTIASARERDLAAFKANVYKRIESSIALSAYIQMWNREQNEIQSIREVQQVLSAEAEQSAQEIGLYQAVTDLLRIILAALVFCAVPLFALQGSDTGSILAAALILLLSVKPLEDIQIAINEHHRAQAATDRIFSILHDLPEIAQNPNAVSPLAIQGKLTFTNVSLTLHEQPVFNNLSFEIPAKQVVALSAPSLQVLSAAITCIPLLIYYNEGSVAIDDIDNRNLALPALHRAISYIGYKPRFLPISLGDNIAAQVERADQASMAAALGKAGVYDLVQTLPGGLQARMDASILNSLSHVAQLRLTIARAYLANAPIVLLEEPLLDVNDEDKASLLPILQDLIKDRTTLLVTRDRDLLNLAQRVLILHNNELKDVSEYGGLEAYKDSLG